MITPRTGDGLRCPSHVRSDNAAVKAEAARLEAESNAAWQARWDAQHAARFTVETCPVFKGGCRVHHTVITQEANS